MQYPWLVSKPDFLTIAVGAISVAAGFLLGGPICGFIFLVLGVCFLVFYVRYDEELVSLGDIDPPAVEIGHPPHVSAQTMPEVVAEKIPPPPVSPILDTASTYLKCIDIKSTSIDLQPNRVVETSHGNYAVYALFRNHPSQPKILPACGVKAHLVFSKGEKEVYSGFGTWIGRFRNQVDFTPGDEEKLLLISLWEQEQSVYAITNSRTAPMPTRTRHLLRTFEHPTVHRYLLVDDSLKITATLIDDTGSHLGEFVFEYRWDNGVVSVTQAGIPVS
jgi:hypothetical protein